MTQLDTQLSTPQQRKCSSKVHQPHRTNPTSAEPIEVPLTYVVNDLQRHPCPSMVRGHPISEGPAVNLNPVRFGHERRLARARYHRRRAREPLARLAGGQLRAHRRPRQGSCCKLAGRSHSGMITMPPERFTQETPKLLASQGFPQLIVAVKVANVGRQPVVNGLTI